MFAFITNHPVITVVLLWGVAVTATILCNHSASVVSGNHDDPYRDVGNGGCTEEGSRRQFELERS